MKLLRPLTITAALAATLAVASSAFAQRPPPPGRPLPPGVGRPPPPGVVVPPPPGARIDYVERQRLYDERYWADRAAARHRADWAATWHERQLASIRAQEGLWGAAFYHNWEVRPEIALNADRCARLARIIDIAEDAHDAALVARAQRVLARENARHARAMAALKIKLGY